MQKTILVLGGGGREHALCVALKKSKHVGMLYCGVGLLPDNIGGNAGIAQIAQIVSLDMNNPHAVVTFCTEKNIDFIVIGPEAPVVAGVSDALRQAGFVCFAPSQAASLLESSKGFTKDLCAELNVPTAKYKRFTSLQASLDSVSEFGLPVVIKADGLAAGKGVIIAETLGQAHEALNFMFEGGFGTAGAEVVIEEFLTGEEASFFVLSDGENIIPLVTAQDHKRVGDGDTGANTGGMGAYSPAPVMTSDMCERAMREIIVPVITEMKKRGTPFTGILYAGLMITQKGPELIEFNVRFGDPECQVLIHRLKSDLYELLYAAATSLADVPAPIWDERPALTVVMAAKGYPEHPQKGGIITLPTITDPDCFIYHAGTATKEGHVIAYGGRVLNITASSDTVKNAAQKAYNIIQNIQWEDGFYRKDIGHRAIAREEERDS